MKTHTNLSRKAVSGSTTTAPTTLKATATKETKAPKSPIPAATVTAAPTTTPATGAVTAAQPATVVTHPRPFSPRGRWNGLTRAHPWIITEATGSLHGVISLIAGYHNDAVPFLEEFAPKGWDSKRRVFTVSRSYRSDGKPYEVALEVIPNGETVLIIIENATANGSTSTSHTAIGKPEEVKRITESRTVDRDRRINY